MTQRDIKSSASDPTPIASIAESACRQGETGGNGIVPMLARLPHIAIGDIKNPAVYLLMCEAAGRVKVGYTRHVDTRIRQLGDGCPYPVYALAVIHTPFYKELEAKIHDDLADRRAHLEWYEMTPDEITRYLIDSGFFTGDLSKLAERYCQHCGAAMTGHVHKRYCSNSCKTAAWRVRKESDTPDIGERVTNATGKRGATVTKHCEFCGAEFETTRATRRYCNSNCRRRAFYQRNPELAEAKAAAWRAELRQRLEARGIAWEERGV